MPGVWLCQQQMCKLLAEGNHSVTANVTNAVGVAAAEASKAIIHSTAPLTITLDDTALTAGETATVTFTFHEAVTGFDNSDITVEGGTLSTVTSADDGITWTATFTPTAGIKDATNLIKVGYDWTYVSSGNAPAVEQQVNAAFTTVAPVGVTVSGIGNSITKTAMGGRVMQAPSRIRSSLQMARYRLR